MSTNHRQLFEKIRRNLIIISIFLTFFLSAGVEIESLNLLGNKINIVNPNIIPFSLWCFWGYLLHRYWSYKSLVISEESYLPKKYEVFENVIKKYATLKANALAERKLQPYSTHEGTQSNFYEITNIDLMKRYNWSFEYHFRILCYVEDEKGPIHINRTITVNNKFIFLVAIIKSNILFLTSTPIFTEYHLPYLISGFPLISLLVKPFF